MLRIIQAPNQVLSKASTPIDPQKIDSNLQAFLKQMEKALDDAEDPKGVGLAEPQVNSSISLFVTKPSPSSKLQVFINPIITSETKLPHPNIKKVSKKSKEKKLEGCLSLKDIWGEVKRSDKVEVSYLDEKGVSHNRKFQGLMSVIVQHEIDHLNGILFPKRVLEQKGKLYKYHEDEDGDMIFDPLII